MATAQLGNLSFRLDPKQVHYAYQIDYATIDTIGGQVVQVLGATLGDLTIVGDFGQDHQNRRESWQLAESFHTSIKAMMDAQTLPTQGSGIGFAHHPIRFTFNSAGMNLDMHVLIKGITDASGTGAIEHSTGKFSYGYMLTLFIVNDATLLLKKVTTDKFISRISSGLGWKSNNFNGSQSLAEALAYIQSNSTDGTFQGYLAGLLAGQPQVPPSTPVQTFGPGSPTPNKPIPGQ
jgi:hypothetical protein